MFVEKGELPFGVVTEGVARRRYTLRPMRVKDSIAARKTADYARAKGDEELLGLLSYAARLTIEGVGQIGLDTMLELFDEDLAEIQAADGRLQEQMARFRGEGEKTADPGAGQDRDAVGVGGKDAPFFGAGVDRSGGGPEPAQPPRLEG